MTVAAAAAALAAGQSPSELAATAASDTAAGDPLNEIRFFKNGWDQGVAYSAMKPGISRLGVVAVHPAGAPCRYITSTCDEAASCAESVFLARTCFVAGFVVTV